MTDRIILHISYLSGEVPGLQPDPLQLSQVSIIFILNSLSTPLAASKNDNFIEKLSLFLRK